MVWQAGTGDRGSKPVNLASVLLPYPLFRVMLGGASFELVLASQLLIALVIALYCAALPAAIAEIFETRTRTTYLSVANGTAVAIFGGFAPFGATLLIERTGSPIASVFLVIAAVLLSLIAILTLRETSREDLG